MCVGIRTNHNTHTQTVRVILTILIFLNILDRAYDEDILFMFWLENVSLAVIIIQLITIKAVGMNIAIVARIS